MAANIAGVAAFTFDRLGNSAEFKSDADGTTCATTDDTKVGERFWPYRPRSPGQPRRP